jgi:hypothetical protein
MRVTLDISRVGHLVNQLGELDSEAFGRMAMQVVNEVADDTYELARPRMLAAINLTDGYVKDRMSVKHATSPDRPSADIVASGASSSMTQLVRYGARQLVQPVKHPKRSKGDQLYARHIAPGMKSAGISVEVTRGGRKPVEHGFFMPLRNGNGVGLFTRHGDGKKDYKIRYGPSVYQLFSHVASGMLGEVGDALEASLVEKATKLMNEKLA